MTKNEGLLENVLRKIGESDPRKIALFNAHIGLKHALLKFGSESLSALIHQGEQAHPFAEPLAAANVLQAWLARGGGDELHRLAALQAAIAIIEASPEFPATVATLQPLCDEREKLRELVRREALALAQAEEDLRQAEIAAVERAKLQAEKDPEVLSARQALKKFFSKA